MTKKKPPAPIAEAPKVRVPETLLAEIDREAELFAPGAALSRTQMVAIALREWLDGRRAQRKGGK